VHAEETISLRRAEDVPSCPMSGQPPRAFYRAYTDYDDLLSDGGGRQQSQLE
jgi:hypothetical protein